MPIGQSLRQIAADMAAQAQQRVSQLDEEISALNTLLAEKKAERDSAHNPKAACEFSFQLGSDCQCPRCWIERETRAALRPMRGGTRTEDLFRCNSCDQTFSVPV